MAKRSPEERFWGKVDRRGPGDCWSWTAKPSHYGYGMFAISHGNRAYAHRYAWQLLIGPIPQGLTLDHLCRNRLCCNPQHLEPVALAENKRRGESTAARNARKTHCKHGHEFTPANTYIRPDNGGRQCRTCRETRLREWKAARVR